MTSVRTTKKPLTGWVSPEIYGKVIQLCSGENSPYKSVSEYITSLVNRDLAIREHTAAHPAQTASPEYSIQESSTQYTSMPDFSTIFIEALNRPDVIEKLKNALQK